MPEFSDATNYKPVHELSKMGIDFVSLCGAGIHPGATVELFKADLSKRDFSTEQRDKLASKGEAMPDGSYPIANTKDLANAIKAYGRAKDPAATKAHIIKRAKALGATDALPADWVSKAGACNKFDGGDHEDHHGDAKCETCGQPKSAHKSDVKKNTNESEGTTTGADDAERSKELTMPEIKKAELPDDLPDEVAAYVAQLEGVVFAEPKPDPIEKADPEVRALLAKAQTEAEEAKAIAKAERELRERNEALAKAESLTALGMETDATADTLQKLNGLDPELAKAVEAMLTSANVAAEKGALFSEIGKSGTSVTGAKIEGLVGELRKADPALTKEQAEARIYRDNPGLYTDYLSEKGA